MAILSIDSDRAARLLNIGPLVIVSTTYQGITNAMPLAWICPMGYNPATISLVMNRGAYTRVLVEKSGLFMVQVPVASQINMVMSLGTQSLADNPNKLAESGVELFTVEGAQGMPMLHGCVAWLLCRLIPDQYLEEHSNMLIARVEDAWIDEDVFDNGYWNLENCATDKQPLHYVAGGQFYTTGKLIQADIDE
ncbi:hypothetical protein CJP74_03910 [Psittacicella melopsittaci]|uniref:Flavin reductase like domain-containing protein n=1 Tax=Psittacicella melopsittaci TaxID=2028576 RepID=A0A3A1Y952_9GAMM|nr:flavin reductase family protein [Psittacicella melopsittaci]RIY32637.1 hypothetical protein CJP74_03910 [Psittacicella melopsittaci]